MIVQKEIGMAVGVGQNPPKTPGLCAAESWHQLTHQQAPAPQLSLVPPAHKDAF